MRREILTVLSVWSKFTFCNIGNNLSAERVIDNISVLVPRLDEICKIEGKDDDRVVYCQRQFDGPRITYIRV